MNADVKFTNICISSLYAMKSCRYTSSLFTRAISLIQVKHFVFDYPFVPKALSTPNFINQCL